jgi:hypothetical protein
VALIAVAEANNWSGWTTIAVGFVVGLFYVLTILVPWLLREQLLRGEEKTHASTNGNGAHPLLGESSGILLPREYAGPPQTHGPVVVKRTEQHVTLV